MLTFSYRIYALLLPCPASDGCQNIPHLAFQGFIYVKVVVVKTNISVNIGNRQRTLACTNAVRSTV